MKLATEREMESNIVVTKKIQALREQYREHNEITYAQGGVESLADTLTAISDRKIYVGEEAIIYFDILDTRDLLKEKYAELTDIEAARLKEDVNDALDEAEKMLNFLGKYVR